MEKALISYLATLLCLFSLILGYKKKHSATLACLIVALYLLIFH